MNYDHLEIWLHTARDFLGRAISGMKFECDEWAVKFSCSCADQLMAEYEKRVKLAEEHYQEELSNQRGIPSRGG